MCVIDRKDISTFGHLQIRLYVHFVPNIHFVPANFALNSLSFVPFCLWYYINIPLLNYIFHSC